MNLKEKFIRFIEDSKLSLDQKELWKLFIFNADNTEQEAVLEAVESGPENLILLTKHLRDKILSMDNIKDNDWDKITDDEEEYAENL